MLHTLLSQVRIDRITNIPADAVMNTFHWQWDDGEVGYTTPSLMGAELVDRLETFYETVDAQLGAVLDADTNSVKVYDLADPEPRLPIYTEVNPFSMSFGAGALPGEVAVVVSFKANNPSGTDARKYRNRIYLGPLAAAVGVIDGGDSVVSSAARTAIAGAAGALLAANDAGLTWVVYSPTDDAVRGIDSGFVDNAFDTQRRRGAKATLRTTF